MIESKSVRSDYYDQLYDVDFLSDKAYDAELGEASVAVRRKTGPDWETWSSDTLDRDRAAELWDSFRASNPEEGLRLTRNLDDDSDGRWLLVQLLAEEMYRSNQTRKFYLLNRILASADQKSLRLKAEKLRRAYHMLDVFSRRLEENESTLFKGVGLASDGYESNGTTTQASRSTCHPVVQMLRRHAARWASENCDSEYTVEDVQVEEPVRADWEKRDISLKDREAVERFYQDTCSYVLELTAANYQVETLFNYSLIIDYLQKLDVSHLYDYGAGIGTFVIFSHLSGISPTYADLGSKTKDYTVERLRDFNLEIPTESLRPRHQELPSNLECVVCTEVLEHIYEPEKLVEEIHRSLRPGGIFVVSESFNYVDEFSTHLPQHEGRGGENFLRWMREVGFREVSLPFRIHPSIHVKT